ncbi:extracellular solute-binding protein [Paenibacillus harenae]|uniref:extracellular solute-binding protein n=1 Tax=Paenibacillus harenae TaxID=306543 RepID=UPI000410A7ED|nr:extracellular solute-binding protein [Paenibacillus harenae]
MKKKWKVSMAAAICMTLLAAGCSGNGEDAGKTTDPGGAESQPNMNAAGFPIVMDQIKLTFMAGQAPTTNPDWNNVRLFNEYEQMTNIDIEWQMVPAAGLKEKFNLVMASRDYPDAFHTARLTASDLTKHGQEGSFIKLDDLIDKHAPNFKKLLDANPALRKGITMPDGHIYSFPTYYDPNFTYLLVSSPLWLNKTWLDKLGMAPPDTTDKFYQYLQAVKTTDLNGNGKNDEIPYAGIKPDNLINHLKGAWGLTNRGRLHAYVDIDPQSDKLRFVPTDPKYKEMLEYIHKLYKEGLINQDIFTVQNNEFYAKGSEGIYGSSIITSMETLMKLTNYIGAPALEGPHGDRVFSFIGSSLASPGAFVITDKNKHPAETVRWIDYFYGDEGNLKFFMGWKDDTYEEQPDGSVQYSQKMVNSPDGKTLEQIVAQSLTWPGGSYPGIVKEKTFKAALPSMIAATETVKPYLPEEVWPAFIYTLEENDQMTQLHNDIDIYVKETQAKFITGSMSFAEWDKYVEQFMKMGLDEYMNIYNAAYERYKKG